MALTQVKSDGIATGAVTATQIATNAVTVDDISDGSISTAKLADDAVTADKLANTDVTAGSYTFANVTVDAQGRLTAASSGTISSDAITEGNTSVEVVDTGSDGHITFDTEGSEAARFDSSQRLLVGTTTYAGNGKLVAAGNTGGSAGTLDITWTGSRPTAANTDIGYLRWYVAENSSSNAHYASITASSDGASSSTSDIPGRLVFSTTADSASSPTERFRIGSAGQLGIGGATYGTSGQVLTSQGSSAAPQWAAGGKLLQVVGTLKTNGFTNTGSGFVDITDLSQSITVSANSRVMVTGHVSATANAWNEGGVLIRILRGTTEVGTSTITPTSGAAGHTGGWDWSTSESYTLRSIYNMPINFVDTALSAGTYTYKIQIRNKGSFNRIQVNSGYYGDTTPEICMTSGLYLMEIGA